MPDADPLCGSAPDPADARDSSDSPPDCPTNHAFGVASYAYRQLGPSARSVGWFRLARSG